ncbi:MAG TPA: hypothetical protein VIM12_03395 [Noviherbaspirillum sp.]|jgi:3-oxoacyl-ACP reductase-like protein|uniref:hypothetical protein n=1 Tax=Noviherbaspirillum sp. TaxID=1926288 RepID=UPI002F95B20A
MSNTTLDAGIPVLTEIIPVPAPQHLPELPPAAAPPAAAILPAASPAPQAPALNSADREQLAHEVQERVMAQLMMRMDQMLELRVRDCLADVLQSSVDRLARELRDGLQQSMREAVSRAVAQEIAELQRTNV